MVNTSKGDSLDRASEHFGNMIKSHFRNHFYGPRLDNNLKWTAKALVPIRGNNFTDLYHILKSDETVRRFRKYIGDSKIRGWITDNLLEFEHEGSITTRRKGKGKRRGLMLVGYPLQKCTKK